MKIQSLTENGNYIHTSMTVQELLDDYNSDFNTQFSSLYTLLTSKGIHSKKLRKGTKILFVQPYGNYAMAEMQLESRIDCSNTLVDTKDCVSHTETAYFTPEVEVIMSRDSYIFSFNDDLFSAEMSDVFFIDDQQTVHFFCGEMSLIDKDNDCDSYTQPDILKSLYAKYDYVIGNT